MVEKLYCAICGEPIRVKKITTIFDPVFPIALADVRFDSGYCKCCKKKVYAAFHNKCLQDNPDSEYFFCSECGFEFNM